MASSKYWEPLSLNGPNAHDSDLSKKLEAYLRGKNCFESEEEAAKREEVLGKLDAIIREWSRKVGIAKGLPDNLAQEASAKLFTLYPKFSFVALFEANHGLPLPSPAHITRQEFFGELYSMLNGHPEVKDLTAVPDAYTPVIKMEFGSISIDLLCASIKMSTIPDNIDVVSNDLVAILDDDRSIRSFNGCRVADMMLRLVPNPPNFRIALKTIKRWATARGVYGNVLGFLGGISWALLTARICQLYPNAAPSTLVHRFFRVFSQWNWKSPIMLCPVEEGGSLSAMVWNPKIRASDRLHLMPILTPAYPCMNSTYNVSESTKKIILAEFQRGFDTMQEIDRKQKPWDVLFEKTNFFDKFAFYLQIECRSDTPETHRKWVGFMESKLRHLILQLERMPSIKLAHPYATSFDRDEDNKKCSTFFMGLEFDMELVRQSKTKQVNLSPAVKGFEDTVNITRPDKDSVNKWNATMTISYHRKTELPLYVFPDGIRPEPRKRRRPEITPTPPAAETTGTNGTSPSVSSPGSAGDPMAASEGTEESASKRRKLEEATPASPTPNGNGTPEQAQQKMEVVEVSPEKHENWGLDDVGNTSHERRRSMPKDTPLPLPTNSKPKLDSLVYG